MIEWPGVALFAILFVWQFPHFMAIGWMYREDYARAGIRLTATLSDTRYAARSTVVQALFYATLMVGVSLWPFVLGTSQGARMPLLPSAFRSAISGTPSGFRGSDLERVRAAGSWPM